MWLVESSCITAKGAPSRGTTSRIGRSQVCTSVWKLVPNWKKSGVVKAIASQRSRSISAVIRPRR